MKKFNPDSLLNLSITDLLRHSLFKDIDGKISNIDGDLSVEYCDIGIGINFNSSNFKVDSIYLYSGSDYTYSRYKNHLPFSLSFSLGRDHVRIKLGSPSREGGGNRSLILGSINHWDSYYFKDYTLRILYSEDLSKIDRITIMTPEATPGRIDKERKSDKELIMHHK